MDQNDKTQVTTPKKPGADKQRPPQIRLPFRPHKAELGEWAYDHRAGLMVTLIVLLVGAIAFMTVKITVGERRGSGTILVEFPPEPELPKLTPEQIKQLQEQSADFSSVQNRISNENAGEDPQKSTSRGVAQQQMDELNESLRDAKGTNAGEIYDEAAAVQDRIRANRQTFEKGRQSERDLANSRTSQTSSQSSDGKGDVRVKGKVTVSFSFTNPVRRSVSLVVPAYQCEGGGEVVLNVVLNRNGRVASATVETALSTRDNCMISTAIKAAKESRFNTDGSAPDRQQGTISYIFIPQ